jgi:type II secretory pathway pseudopilin PulG
MRIDQYRTASTESALRTERARTFATLRLLVSARAQAQDAISVDEAILSHVNANLLSLVTAANERREAAEEQEAEQEAAAAAAAAQQQATTTTARPVTTTTAPRRVTTTTAPPTVTTTTVPVTTTTVPAPTPPSSPQPGTGGYTNPLRAINGLAPERIDQGVDYGGYGPIYALGDGVVLSTVNAGWPGGTFITYQLSSGPGSGLLVYAAEDIDPSVQVGQTVTPSTVLGQMYEGPDGIETGWADPSALGSTMAAEYGQFSGSNSTAFGYNFSQLLSALGAPGGVLQNNPPTGYLPAQWPQW